MQIHCATVYLGSTIIIITVKETTLSPAKSRVYNLLLPDL